MGLSLRVCMRLCPDLVCVWWVRNHVLLRKYESEQRTLKKNAARMDASRNVIK